MSNFQTLRNINVNDKTEKKNGLTYLSWAWAVDQLLLADPAANWEYHEPQMFGDTMMVSCTVTAFGKPVREYLPVLDYKNRAVPQPDAMAVNTAMKRCLTKCIGLHGLGLYIYAGEDLPPDEAHPQEVVAQMTPTAQMQDDINALDKLTQKKVFAVADEVHAEFERSHMDAYTAYCNLRDSLGDVTAQSALRGLLTKEEKRAFGDFAKQAAQPKPMKEAA